MFEIRASASSRTTQKDPVSNKKEPVIRVLLKKCGFTGVPGTGYFKVVFHFELQRDSAS